MNGEEKNILNDLYEKMGKVESKVITIHNTTKEIKQRLKSGDKKFDEMQKQIDSNKFRIGLIWKGAGAAVLAIGAMLFRLAKKIGGL